MIARQEGQEKNRLLFWAVLSLIFVLPLALRNPFARTCGQLMGYIVILYIVSSGIRENCLQITRNAASLFGVIFFWIVISVLNSIRFYSEYGTLSGETTFTAPLGSVYFHLFHTALFTGYISLVRERTNVEYTLKKAFNAIVWIQIIVGIIQLMIIADIPGIAGIYDGINFLGMMATASFIREMSRITLTGLEPASMGSSLGMLSFPYLLAVLHETKSSKERTSCFIKLIVLLVLSYYSKSTTLFGIIAVSALAFVFWSARESRVSKRTAIIWVIVIIGVTLVLMLNAIHGSVRFGGNILEEIQYYLFVKPIDTTNMSTMHRLSPIVNDIAIIKKHPLLGVGDGNQGFTYGQNVPSYMLINPKSQNFARGIGGVVNGGAWFWAVLSGYGVFGFMALLVWYVNHYRYRVKDLKNNYNFLYSYYIYSLPAIIMTLLTGAMGPTIIFVLSIPLWELAIKEGYNE